MITIQPAMQPDLTLPYPYHLDAEGTVLRQDFWKGDPAGLLGFQDKPDVQKVNLSLEDFLAAPHMAAGKYPVFVRDNGSIYALTLAIERVNDDQALGKIHPALAHPALTLAVAAWCDQTGAEQSALPVDEDFMAVVQVLAAAELLDFGTDKGAQATPSAEGAAARAALVLLAGAELAALGRTAIASATQRVADAVILSLGTPTGFEGEPDRLARLIHHETSPEAM